MELMDDLNKIIDEITNEKNRRLEIIFKHFNVKMTDHNHLVLPEKFKKSIGEGYDRIHFSKYIENDTGYVLKKPIEDFSFGTFLSSYPIKGEN